MADVKDQVLRHLSRDYFRPVRDPLWKHIYLSDGLMAIFDTSEFQQLSRIKQLGPSYLVYPGATHTRLAHSLGVYHIAFRVMQTLLAHDGCPQVNVESVRAYLCAAMLHDLGHFPYTHSLKELPLTDHEKLAGQMIRDGKLATVIRDEVKTDPEMVAAIVDESLPFDGNREVRFFRALLSGSLDPDKLDYLNRDAYFCGVPYGTQDIDFALSRIVPLGDDGIALERSGVSAVENVLFSKYLMYRAVYWHRTVRVATAMIKKGLYLSLSQGLIDPGDLYGLSDESFYTGFSARSEAPFELIRRVYDRKLHSLVAECPFNPSLEAHSRLETLDNRTAVERRIANEIASRTGTHVEDTEVVIDVPEGISFEVEFPVIDGERIISYPESDTVFTPTVVADFTRTLRRIRLMVAPEAAANLTETKWILDLLSEVQD